MYTKSVLNNGLRVVTEELPAFRSAAVGLWLTVGSRDETAAEGGLTHFLEHMAFKGTGRRNTYEIAREIDQLGGLGNAFTTKEHTCYHARVLAEHLPRAVDLLADLVLHPLYLEEEMERERQVILEEIAAQDDTPEDLVQVLFARDFWQGQPLGRPILGHTAAVGSFRQDHLLAYRQSTYRPEHLVVAAAGRLRHQEVLDLVEPLFENFSNGSPRRTRPGAAPSPGVHLHPRDLEQLHLVMGAPGLPAADDRRFAATVLNLILGGNMSSRLFQVVREQLGLAYSIYSHLSFFSDVGLLEIAAGVNPRNLPVLVRAVNLELARFKEEPLPAEELDAAKEYLKGSLALNTEDCEQRMLRLARNEIYFGRHLSVEEVLEGLNRVTAAEVQDLAREFFQPHRWALTLLGPLDGPAPEPEF
ncbi:MAG: insulinase family protein [Deltaproteobacteria bacterium]|nr:insulinase family protein [Deltaproteobacteria bacterium]